MNNTSKNTSKNTGKMYPSVLIFFKGESCIAIRFYSPQYLFSLLYLRVLPPSRPDFTSQYRPLVSNSLLNLQFVANRVVSGLTPMLERSTQYS